MVHYFHSDIAQKYGINAAVLAVHLGMYRGQEHTAAAVTRGQGLVSLLGADVDGVLSVPFL